jgi:DNA-binding NarL/FixJ family response regulator
MTESRANGRRTPLATALAHARGEHSRTPTTSPDRDRPIRVVLADDSYLIREALQEILAPVDQVELVAMYADGDSLLAAVEADPPDVIITDIRMPPGGDDEGIRIARQVHDTHPTLGVIVLSQYADAGYALSLLEDGAAGRGYVLKDRVHDRAELIAAIEVVARGGTTIDPGLVHDLLAADRPRQRSPLDELTPREREVLAEMAEGKSNAAIAESLVLTKRAVEKHVGAIFQKLGLEDDEVVSRRVTAVLLYLASASV